MVALPLQGRLNATMRTFVWATLPLGSLAGGYLASAVGTPFTILIGTIVVALSAFWLLPVRERYDIVSDLRTGHARHEFLDIVVTIASRGVVGNPWRSHCRAAPARCVLQSSVVVRIFIRHLRNHALQLRKRLRLLFKKFTVMRFDAIGRRIRQDVGHDPNASSYAYAT